ncbi:MAG TPA: DNA-binding protein WhiA [Candidatus Corynebacterium avicola]|uniref:Probable cell division protein WhiA n=1 Tax=Candidatus Corynebacterium avicola TaxID=2838527 RepID=A0A9D1RMG3_9CORY|nr:DNA-binding protein WhiA [Candidatus Corynebacterium avicola]
MALTAEVKDELARVTVTRPEEMTAEIAGLLRYSAGLHLVAGRIVVEAEVDSGATARRVSQAVDELFDLTAEMQVVGGGNLRTSARYVLRWSEGGTDLARRTGLIDRAGRPVRGLPPFIIGGTAEQCVAAWRGAFLARGSLTEPGRSSALEVTTPGNEAALALVGAARRIGVTAKSKETRGVMRVVIRDGETIGDLLTRMGAQRTKLQWEEQRMRREVRATANRLANFDDANLRRSARAAVVAAARVARALEILGEDVPDHLVEAGTLRVQHRQASLEELGQLADPPMTKDAVAGRVRRLLTMADRRAAELGIPDTSAAVTDDIFDIEDPVDEPGN